MPQLPQIHNPEALRELADLQQQLRGTLLQAKRLRKYSRAGNFTPVEQVVWRNLLDAEQRLRRILDNLAAATGQEDRTARGSPDGVTK